VAEFIGQANFLPGRIEALQDGIAQVRVLERSIEAEIDSGAGHQVGDTVTLVIRPEWLSLQANGTPNGGLSGEICRAVFLGSVAEYDVQLDNGPSLTAALHGTRARRQHRVGERVSLDLPGGAAFVLPQNG
jgi:iron(III) transport system ATP-binding protein